VFCEVWTPEEVEPGVVVEGKLACDGHDGDVTAPWPLAPELASFFVAYAVDMARPRHFELPAPARGVRGSWGVRVRTSLPVLGVDLLPLPSERDGARHRRAVAVRVDVGGAPVTVVGLHGSAEIPFGPVRQLAALRAQLPDGPVVVTGDLNTWLPVARRLLGSELRPAVKAPTWPAGLPFAQIDHIFVRGLTPLASRGHRRRPAGAARAPGAREPRPGLAGSGRPPGCATPPSPPSARLGSQDPPGPGIPELPHAVAHHQQRFYGSELRPGQRDRRHQR
jgi:hypothetical protein